MNKWKNRNAANSGDEDDTQPLDDVLLSIEAMDDAHDGWRLEARQMLEQLRAEDDTQEIVVVKYDAATG